MKIDIKAMENVAKYDMPKVSNNLNNAKSRAGALIVPDSYTYAADVKYLKAKIENFATKTNNLTTQVLKKKTQMERLMAGNLDVVNSKVKTQVKVQPTFTKEQEDEFDNYIKSATSSPDIEMYKYIMKSPGGSKLKAMDMYFRNKELLKDSLIKERKNNKYTPATQEEVELMREYESYIEVADEATKKKYDGITSYEDKLKEFAKNREQNNQECEENKKEKYRAELDAILNDTTAYDPSTRLMYELIKKEKGYDEALRLYVQNKDNLKVSKGNAASLQIQFNEAMIGTMETMADGGLSGLHEVSIVWDKIRYAYYNFRGNEKGKEQVKKDMIDTANMFNNIIGYNWVDGHRNAAMENDYVRSHIIYADENMQIGGETYNKFVAFESGIMKTLISKKAPLLGLLGRAGEAAQGVYDNFEYNGIDDTKDVDYIFWTSLIRQGQQVLSDVASKKLTDGLNSVIDEKISNPIQQMFTYLAGHSVVGGVVSGGEFLLDNGLEFLYATLFGSKEDKERYYMDNNPDSLLEDTLLVMWEGAKSTGTSDLLQFAKNLGYLTTSKYNGKNNAQLLADLERTGVDLGDVPKAERDAYVEYFSNSYHDSSSSTTDTNLSEFNDSADKFGDNKEKTDYTTADLKESTKDKKPIAIQVYEDLCEYKADNVTINGETIKDTYLYVSNKGDSYAVAKVADANGKIKYITYEYIHDSSGTVQVNVKEYSKQQFSYIDQYYDNISKTN